MKKTFLTLIVIAGLSASCKKNYTCTCLDANTGAVTTSTIKSSSSSSAQTDCSTKNSTGVDCNIN